MAQIGWSETDPPETASAGLGDDAIRSLKTSLRQGLDQEHIWPSAGGDAGVHRLGSSRVFYGPQSTVSSAGTDGKMQFTSDTSRLFHVGSGGTSYIGGPTGISLAPGYLTYPQRSQWVEEVGIGATTSVGSVLVTIPNSGYSGLPYLWVTQRQASLASNAYLLATVNVDASTFIVEGWNPPTMALVADVEFFWRSLGTRVL